MACMVFGLKKARSILHSQTSVFFTGLVLKSKRTKNIRLTKVLSYHIVRVGKVLDKRVLDIGIIRLILSCPK